VLFLATAASVYLMGANLWGDGPGFAIPLLAILVAHESGHYLMARWHRESTGLPYFLPLPLLSPFGTLGAVILAPGRIRSRAALLDIGAGGPLAGMVVSVPVMVYGLSLSKVGALGAHYWQEGQSLLYWVLKRLMFGPIPAGHDVTIHPVAVAGWAGFFVTFLNLFPVGQLDGGHVAYALLGRRHGWLARAAAAAPLGLILYNLAVFGVPLGKRLLEGAASPEGAWETLWSAVSTWLVPLVLFVVMGRKIGFEHPPVDDETPLGWVRTTIALITLSLFVLLFMPSPWVTY
jgi:membrane-associated protease RseP (regulator of RpoE activity)